MGVLVMVVVVMGDDGDGMTMATMRATGEGGTKGFLLWRGKASWGEKRVWVLGPFSQ